MPLVSEGFDVQGIQGRLCHVTALQHVKVSECSGCLAVVKRGCEYAIVHLLYGRLFVILEMSPPLSRIQRHILDE